MPPSSMNPRVLSGEQGGGVPVNSNVGKSGPLPASIARTMRNRRGMPTWLPCVLTFEMHSMEDSTARSLAAASATTAAGMSEY